MWVVVGSALLELGGGRAPRALPTWLPTAADELESASEREREREGGSEREGERAREREGGRGRFPSIQRCTPKRGGVRTAAGGEGGGCLPLMRHEREREREYVWMCRDYRFRVRLRMA